jgi:hypothetical protein
MKLLYCLPMFFGFPNFCCLPGWWWIGCDRSCTALNLIDEIASDCYWSHPLSLVLVLLSASQRVNICSRSYLDLLQGEGPKWRTRGGEWMGADKNSIQEFGLWTRFHSCTSTSFSCQAHVAETHTTWLLAPQTGQVSLWNRSDRFCWI